MFEANLGINPLKNKLLETLGNGGCNKFAFKSVKM